jgi:hypothetical protein
MIISIGTSCGANAENASVIFYKVWYKNNYVNSVKKI